MTEDGNAARAQAMFGDYDIVETVGQGGMGIVYRAIDTSLGRTVALKVLKDDLRTHKAVVARFQREAQAYASLNHPNIVQIFSVGAVGDIPYIAMELVDGEPLSAMMKRERRIPWKRALAIGEQVAEALGSAHDAQIIHRDIKPGNILIAKGDRTFVTDFGIAKVLTAETQLTVDGSRLGTPQYMSPERCQNAEITFSSDLYSLGIVLFQMISGRLPYESEDPVDLIRKVVFDPPRRLSEFMPEIPEDVERLIAFLIEKKVENRPVSAEEWVYLSGRVREGKSMVEDDSGLESSIKSFRDSQPTPSSSSFTDSNFTEEHPTVIHRVKMFWGEQSLNTKTLLLSVCIAAVMGTFGWLYAVGAGPSTANDLAVELGVSEGDWNAGKGIASFYQEMPGLTLVQLDNLDWIPSPAGWLDASSGLVLIEGRAGSPWEGKYGVLMIREGEKEARIVIAPTTVDSMHVVGVNSTRATALIALGDMGSIDQQLYGIDLSTDSSSIVERHFLSTILGKSANDAFKTIQQVVFTDSDARMFTVGESHASLGEWGIYPIEKGKSAGRSVVPTGSSIGGIALSRDGDRTVYSRVQPDGTVELYSAMTNGTESDEALITDAMNGAKVFALHPSGTQVLAVEIGARDGSEVVLYELDTLTRTLLFSDALDVRWHPNGVDGIVLAPDRKEVNQLWQVSTVEPNPRRQITFLEDGVGRIGQLSRDGKTLLSTTGSENKPSLIVIELERVTSTL